MENNFCFWWIFCSLIVFDKVLSTKEHVDFISTTGDSNSQTEKPATEAKACNSDNGLIIINTIDGNLTALDPQNGNLCWKINVNSLGLISSSLENLQVEDNGSIIRLVPSLDGRLFKFENSKLEPLPITAESMLKSSSKIGDNLSIIGEREKKVSGFNLLSGEGCYQCTSKKCLQLMNCSESDTVLVVEQVSHNVHAVNSQKGISQWNFRVAELQLTVAAAADPGKTFEEDSNSASYKYALVTEEIFNQEKLISALKIAMNGGYIGIFNESSSRFDWFQKFSNPIVDVWYVKDKMVHAVDQFDEKSKFLFSNGHNRNSVASLFIGTFNNQLFIKQSKKLKSKITAIKVASNDVRCSITNAVSTMSPLAKDVPEILFQDEENSLIPLQNTDVAPILDHGEYYYINYSIILNDTHCILNRSFPMAILHVWESNPFFTWISVIVATILLTVSSTVIIFRLFMKSREDYLNCDILSEIEVFERSPNSIIENSSIFMERPASIVEPEFVSRFLQDFAIIKVLGKGGFGLVIEAKNNIDDCCYAVKRIQYFEDISGENMFTKVMREVKALAVLDHPGIVRYFNAWTEVPPEGWQKNKDMEHHIVDKFPDLTSVSSAKVISSSTHPRKVLLKGAMNKNPLRLFDIPDISSSSSEEKLSFSTKHISSESSCVAYLYIQMQLCRKDTLRDWLTKNDSARNHNNVLKMFNQIVDAVEYVHQCGLMHRDLKPSNIFFSLDGNIKIGDFGLAATTNAMVEECDECVINSSSNVRTKHVGTYLYMSPEQRIRKNYDSKTDIFALGIIFFELLVPFHSCMERIRVINKVRKLQFPKDFINDFKSEHKLAKEMLQADPQRRPSASIIKSHHLFK